MTKRARFFWLTGALAALTISAASGCGSDDEPTGSSGSSGKGGTGARGGTGAKSGTGGTAGKAGTGGTGGTAGKAGSGGASGTAGASGAGGKAGAGGTTDGGAGASDGSAGTGDGAGGAAGTTDSGSSDAADATAAAATCTSYCADINTSCSAGADQQYGSANQCNEVCKLLPAGTVGATSGNNLQCRAGRAAAAAANKTACDAAGPAGVGTCGTPCEFYCMMMAAVCPGSLAADAGTCEQQCAALPDANLTNFQANQPGDTLQCRIYHVSNAAEQQADAGLRAVHCGHAAGANPC